MALGGTLVGLFSPLRKASARQPARNGALVSPLVARRWLIIVLNRIHFRDAPEQGVRRQTDPVI
jgi:hypothetical protein